jgi:hypothetical protein
MTAAVGNIENFVAKIAASRNSAAHCAQKIVRSGQRLRRIEPAAGGLADRPASPRHGGIFLITVATHVADRERHDVGRYGERLAPIAAPGDPRGGHDPRAQPDALNHPAH